MDLRFSLCIEYFENILKKKELFRTNHNQNTSFEHQSIKYESLFD